MTSSLFLSPNLVVSKNFLNSHGLESAFLGKTNVNVQNATLYSGKNSKICVNKSHVINSMFGGSSRYGNRRLRMQATTGEQVTIRSVPVQVVKELLEAGHIYLDVRTPEEFSEGHVEGSVNIPYMFRRNGGMTKNENFLLDVKAMFDPRDELVVGCLSGKRSLMAVKELHSADYVCVTDMGGGIEAWKESGLPVTKM